GRAPHQTMTSRFRVSLKSPADQTVQPRSDSPQPRTLPVGLSRSDSPSVGLSLNQADNSTGASGAAYVFSRVGTSWAQDAYVKSSNTGAGDYFGCSIALAGDGTT